MIKRWKMDIPEVRHGLSRNLKVAGAKVKGSSYPERTPNEDQINRQNGKEEISVRREDGE